MVTVIQNWIINSGVNEKFAKYIAYAVLAIVVMVTCMLAIYITKKIVLRLIVRSIKSNKIKFDDFLLKNRVFQRLAHIVPALIIQLFSFSFVPHNNIFFIVINKCVVIYFIIIGLFVFDSLLDTVDDIYKTHEVSKTRPIKGYLQVVKIVVYIIGGIVIIANLMGENPLGFLGGIGALTAVFSLVFKDSILGLVAGIQLSANDMVRIGDWIEMPKYSADGDVIDISLNTVKVQNFDKTITTIPAYALVSDSFKNWRGMQSSGGRRIMRSVIIDINSITFCSDQLLDKLKKTDYLKEYIENKQTEFNKYNNSIRLNAVEAINTKQLTNIGLFRVYLQKYLQNHPRIHKDMTQLIRQLPPDKNGVALQIYAFTNETDWLVYEDIQADIFDHILSIVPQFELRVFQEPTGYDFNSMKNTENSIL